MEEKNQEFYEIINPILNSEEFIKRKDYVHHKDVSVYDHCLKVAYKAYLLAIKFKADKIVAARAGLLHDFYYKPWLDEEGKIVGGKKPFFKKHGFVHAKEALDNSIKHFPNFMDEKTRDAILKHMFPLNKNIPRYKESWLVNLADKYVSLEIFKHPTKLLMYVGIKGRKKDD